MRCSNREYGSLKMLCLCCLRPVLRGNALFSFISFFWMMLLTKKNITRVTRMTLIYDKEEKDFNALFCSFWKLFCKYSLKFMYVSIFKYQLINDNFLWKKIQWWVLHLFNNIFFHIDFNNCIYRYMFVHTSISVYQQCLKIL